MSKSLVDLREGILYILETSAEIHCRQISMIKNFHDCIFLQIISLESRGETDLIIHGLDRITDFETQIGSFPFRGNFELCPLEVAMGNAVSVTHV